MFSIKLQRFDGSFWSEEWERVPDLYCPKCGQKTVWHDTGPGDYYAGEMFLCTSCSAVGYGWSYAFTAHSEDDLRRVMHARKAAQGEKP